MHTIHAQGWASVSSFLPQTIDRSIPQQVYNLKELNAYRPDWAPCSALNLTEIRYTRPAGSGPVRSMVEYYACTHGAY